ncbi:hydrogenase maturation nickel metallochaperone HypA [Corynebacterium choanae]|uniref:Hydrogenase nickel incorporation protein HypA n=1 Tax=Corynebacterium choanae TaxID=1862358 RepID=A0A3G6JB99_9CORY|nr:hydrogenase maturation nickel metallochaperone HypA [Corynebacterium choanae]AZA14328.1 hydrogenase nickel incorporation protein HypA [Corynebacterium choanae]
MHEVALATQIARIVARHTPAPVRYVNITIGARRGVVPASLTYAWNFVTSGTSLAGSTLQCTYQPAILACTTGHTSTIDDPRLPVCPLCQASGTWVDENPFTVTSIDLA